MRSAFGSRRKGRRIGQDEDDGDDEAAPSPTPASTGDRGPQDPGSGDDSHYTVKAPSRPKKKSTLRLSFGPGQAETEAKDDDGQTFTPKKSNLSRRAMEQNAVRKSLGHSLPTDRLPIRASDGDDRPRYGSEELQELKSSTPATPQDARALIRPGADALNVVGKFGGVASTVDEDVIPSQAEIEEKKQRRARLAREQDYIGLGDGGDEDGDDDEEDETGELSVYQKPKKYAETRLVRDDEDLGEGFDDFVEDGRISLGRKAEREQQRRKREAMQEMIDEAEGSSEDDSSDSDGARKAAYEVAQTRAGTYGTTRSADGRRHRPRTPPKITPLPSLSEIMDRLRAEVQRLEQAKVQNEQKLEELVQEKADMEAREADIQRLLKETGDRYEQLSVEAGLGGKPNGSAIAGKPPGDGPMLIDRGLETFGERPAESAEGE